MSKSYWKKSIFQKVRVHFGPSFLGPTQKVLVFAISTYFFIHALNNVIDITVTQPPKLCIKGDSVKIPRIYTNQGWKNTKTNCMVDLRCKEGYATMTVSQAGQRGRPYQFSHNNFKFRSQNSKIIFKCLVLCWHISKNARRNCFV